MVWLKCTLSSSSCTDWAGSGRSENSGYTSSRICGKGFRQRFSSKSSGRPQLPITQKYCGP